jgi:hypothetical protein
MDEAPRKVVYTEQGIEKAIIGMVDEDEHFMNVTNEKGTMRINKSIVLLIKNCNGGV